MVLPAVSKVGRSEKTPAGPKHSLPDMGVEGRAGVNIRVVSWSIALWSAIVPTLVALSTPGLILPLEAYSARTAPAVLAH
jgi:hypothetical protein